MLGEVHQADRKAADALSFVAHPVGKLQKVERMR
jgi:hypothetical protein